VSYKHARTKGWRGSIGLYAGSFLLLIVSAFLLFKANTHSQLRLVWWSMGVSAGAVLLALASIMFPRA
jgi:hypothetical protein